MAQINLFKIRLTMSISFIRKDYLFRNIFQQNLFRNANSKGFSKNVYYECLKIYYILNIFP